MGRPGRPGQLGSGVQARVAEALTVPSRSARRGLLGFVIAFLVIAELFYHIFRRCQPLFRQERAQKEEHGRQQAGQEHGREPGRGLEKGVYPGVPQGAESRSRVRSMNRRKGWPAERRGPEGQSP